MRKASLSLIAAALVGASALISQAEQTARITDVAVAPHVVKPGDIITTTAKVDDPQHRVARVAAVSVEFTRMHHIHIALPLHHAEKAGDKRAGNGLWTSQFYIPAAPSGVYHFEIVLFDAAGSRLASPGHSTAATVALELRNEGGLASAQLRAAAAPWRPTAQMRNLKALHHRKPGEAFRFMATGDSCYHPDVFRDFLAIMARLRPDFSVDCGDIVDGEDDPWEWPRFFGQLHRSCVDWPFFVVLGNHDIWPWQVPPGGKRSPQGKLFEELFGPVDYYFDHGDFRFVVMDTGRFATSEERLKWLDRVLDTPLRKIVFTHVPPVVIAKWAQFGPGNTFSSGAQEFADLVAARKVERVYVGHIHMLDVAEYKGVCYVITGPAGQWPNEEIPGDPRAFHHLILVEAGSGLLREIIYKRDGTSFVLDRDKWMAGHWQ